jgi:2-oxoglutarate ferredoxin oxidoreductase subunit beta
MGKTFQKPESLAEQITHYCPGCTHGIIHRLLAEVIDELGIRGRTVGVAPVGCAVLMYNYFTFDFLESAHGRAPAQATGIKRVRPDLVVFTYQGDGDLASIGMSEIVHAANRGEKFTTIFINNAVYGMTEPAHDDFAFRAQSRGCRHADENVRDACNASDAGLHR